MTTEHLREVPVERNDTLWKIAHRNRVSVKQIAEVNPQIKDLDKLDIGQKIKIPGNDIGFTLRFVNLLNQPPVGIRYKVLAGKRELVTGKVTAADNETSFGARDGEVLTLMAQRKGVTELVPVAQIPVRRRHPVMIVRINSAKIPSKTEPHPKTPPAPPKAAPKPAAPPPAAKPPAPAPAPKPAAPAPAAKPPAPAPAAKPAPKPAPPAKKVDQGVPNTPAKNNKTEPEHQIVPGDCACGKDLTIDQLAAIFPSKKKPHLEKFRPHINSMFKRYKVDSCLRKSHLLAQMGHESGSFQYMAELVSDAVADEKYGGYKGRGLIQLTFKDTYKKYGEHVGVDFLGANKTKLESIEYATDSAGWFWCYGKKVDMNEWADKNDLLQITAKVNGAFNGYDDRVNIFRRAHKALAAPACKTPGNRSPVFLPFEQSLVYQNAGSAFGWAYWHDPASSKHGTPKNLAIAKAAYKRFLDLHKVNPSPKRFGMKPEKLVEHANKRIEASK